MPTACINQPGVRVNLCGERLEVHGLNHATDRDELLREIPLRDLDRLIASESVHFTTPALAELLRRGIPVQMFSWNGRFLGNFLPAQNHHGLARLRQYECSRDAQFCLQMSGRIVAAKLYNQRRILQRLLAGRKAELAPLLSEDQPRLPGDPLSQTATDLAWLDAVFASLRGASSIDELRGYEGASTARYFQAWSRFLPAPFPFERRSTRPPLNPVNACISFASTIIYNEAVAFIHAHGLDPALGVFHSIEDGRWSLALDLMEPFRPVVAEALALDLFSHGILGDSHFEQRDGGVFLGEEGRKKFFMQYERRMERQFMSECAGCRTTLRQQLEQQAVMFKSALTEPAKFEPFLMN